MGLLAGLLIMVFGVHVQDFLIFAMKPEPMDNANCTNDTAGTPRLTGET